MASNSEIFLARADECERDLEKTSRPNVRDQLMRSANAWRAMGEAALVSESLQAKAKNKSVDVDDMYAEDQTAMKVLT
jgi:hypothetical protein